MSFSYTVKYSDRKSIGLTVKDGQLIVRAPRRAKQADIERVIRSHTDWIEKAMAKQAAIKEADKDIPKLTEAELRVLADKALKVIPERVRYYAPLVGVTYGRITIRNQKTKWGSCSGKKNLNFNCLLMLAPPEVLDSVVVHELCHLKHMDHSPAFYAEVRRVMPDYDQRHAWLKEHGHTLLKRMLG